jgi:hypothetical protein
MQMEPEVTSEPAGKSAADLPADYTKDGGLLDVEYALSGVPALRASRVDIKLSPQIHGASDGGKGDECFRRPTAEQLAYRDDTGANILWLFPTFGDVPSHGPPVSPTTPLNILCFNRENMKRNLKNCLVLSRPFGNFAEGIQMLLVVSQSG